MSTNFGLDSMNLSNEIATEAPQPLFILGSPRSFTSIVCGMLGQHPQLFGVPELNLMVQPTLRKMWQSASGDNYFMLHGLLRAAAYLYCGEQTFESIQAAQRWCLNRYSSSTAEIYWELCKKVSPLRIVDKSPVYGNNPETLRRIKKTFPKAYFLHLLRHPRTQGESMMRLNNGIMTTKFDSIDYTTNPPTPDPQISWYIMQSNILEFLKDIPSKQKFQIKGEDFLNNPTTYLEIICNWVGISMEPEFIKPMFHPENAFFAAPGPWGAHAGSDPNFLRSPTFQAKPITPSFLMGALPWRPDGKGFRSSVIEMAQNFGYQDDETVPAFLKESKGVHKKQNVSVGQGHLPRPTSNSIIETSTSEDELKRRYKELSFYQRSIQVMFQEILEDFEALPQIIEIENSHDVPAFIKRLKTSSEQNNTNDRNRPPSLQLLLNKPNFFDDLNRSDALDAPEDIKKRTKLLRHRAMWLEALKNIRERELVWLNQNQPSRQEQLKAPVVIASVEAKKIPQQFRIYDPAPSHGLQQYDFRKICANGFGDGNNCYAHSMTWFKNHIFVGTTRANFSLIRKSGAVKLGIWPVDCSNPPYSSEFEKTQARAEIWRYNPRHKEWVRALQAPLIDNGEDGLMSRELGYRRMTIFQGKSDLAPALYISNWSRSRSPGTILLRSEDGIKFQPVPDMGNLGLGITTIRSLVPFKGRLFTAPTSKIGATNISFLSLVYVTEDPAYGKWEACNTPGFGDPKNVGIFELAEDGEFLYAGTVNNAGFQLWRTRGEGPPPFSWEKVLDQGAGRGSLNQAIVSMVDFKDSLYIGTGIQNGGYDVVNNIGPAGAELLRINRNGSWDILVGDERQTSDGFKTPLSGINAGFGDVFNGYFWKVSHHNGWLYVGTMHWSIMLRYCGLEKKSGKASKLLQNFGIEDLLSNQSGFQLWRSFDGENWVSVSRDGLGNPYNYGIRNLVSTPYGLFVGTANPFGPNVAVHKEDGWKYEDNPFGGLEIWQGSLKTD